MKILIVIFYVLVIQLAAAEEGAVVSSNIIVPEFGRLGLSPEQQINYKNQHEKIISYLGGQNKSEWEGEYSEGMMTGSNLFLTKNNGFSYMSWGCLGAYGIAYGESKFLSDKATFLNKTSEHFPKEIFFIKWGERHYLIPNKRVIDFANAVNSGTEPCERGGCSFWLKNGDVDKQVKGLPTIPEYYRDYLLKKPINAKIIEIKDSQINYKDPKFPVRKTIVAIDVGAQQGVKMGMLFSTLPSNEVYETATVVEVLSSSSLAEIVEYSLDDDKPSIGRKFSTRH